MNIVLGLTCAALIVLTCLVTVQAVCLTLQFADVTEKIHHAWPMTVVFIVGTPGVLEGVPGAPQLSGLIYFL